MENALEEVLRVMPEGWSKVGSFLKEVRAYPDADELCEQHPPFKEMLVLPFTDDVVYGLRMQLLYHILSALALQQCNIMGSSSSSSSASTGSNTYQSAYAHTILHQHFQDMLGKFDMTRLRQYSL